MKLLLPPKRMFIPDVIKLSQGIHVTVIRAVIIMNDYDLISHSSYVFGKA